MLKKKDLKIKKAIILSIGNSDNFNYIKIKKNKNIGIWLSKFLRKSFDEYYDPYIENHIHKGKKIISKKTRIEKLIDYHEAITRGNKYINDKIIKVRPRIDIFHGYKSIFIIILCSKKERNKFIKILNEMGNFYISKNKNNI